MGGGLIMNLINDFCTGALFYMALITLLVLLTKDLSEDD